MARGGLRRRASYAAVITNLRAVCRILALFYGGHNHLLFVPLG